MADVSHEDRRIASEVDALHARVNAGLYPRQNFWRVGRKVGRTIYAQIAAKPSDDDPLIGMMDTRGLAEEAVRAHNASLRSGSEPLNPDAPADPATGSVG